MSLNGYLGCQSGLQCTDRGFVHHPPSISREVICPKPQRAKAPFMSDSLDRCSHRLPRNLSLIGGDSGQEIRDFFDLLREVLLLPIDHDLYFTPSEQEVVMTIPINQGDMELMLDGRQVGLYNCSPPVRTSNPIVHDIQFLSQASNIDFPSESAHGVVLDEAKEKGGQSLGTSVHEPLMWIEEFSRWMKTTVFLHFINP